MGLFDVVVIGDANPDLIMSGGDVVPRFGQSEGLVDDSVLTLGGSAAITAAGLGRLGANVGIVAVVGDDRLGELTVTQLDDSGVDTSDVVIDPEVSTGVSVHLVDGDDRGIITHIGAIAALERHHISAAVIESARHVHVGSVFLLRGLRPDLADVLVQARSAGATTSLDANWDPSEQWDVLDLLAECDVLFPNEAEAVALTGCSDREAAIENLRSHDLTVALKCGESGGLVVADKVRRRVGAPPSVVVDAIGAGDSFDAGYIFAMVNGASPSDALAMAVACGSLSTRAAGGTSAQPALAEAKALATVLR